MTYCSEMKPSVRSRKRERGRKRSQYHKQDSSWFKSITQKECRILVGSRRKGKIKWKGKRREKWRMSSNKRSLTRLKRMKGLRSCIQCCSRCKRMKTKGSIEWVSRFERAVDIVNINEYVKFKRRAVELPQPGHSFLSHWYSSLTSEKYKPG